MTVTPSDATALDHAARPDPAPGDEPGGAPELPSTEPVRTSRRLTARVAGVLVGALAVVLLVGGLALASFRPASGPSILDRYAPADTTMYVEARLDLPGDQQQLMVQFLRHFPGFDDQAAFERRIGDLFDRLAAESEEGIRWATDVQPWFGGQIAVFATVPPSGDTDPGDVVLAVSVKDRQAAREFLAARAANHAWTSEEYQGATLWSGRLRGEDAVIALTADAILAGRNPAKVRTALDVGAGAAANLGTNATYTDALARLHADRLATFYLDGAALADLDDDQMEPFSGLPPFASTPGLTVGELRAEGNHLALTTRTRPGPDGPPLPENRTTDLSARAPADSMLFVETRQTGATLERYLRPLLERMRDGRQGGTEGGFDAQIETLLGMPPEEYLDFLDDVSLSVSAGNGQVSGGLIATVTDEEVAEQRTERLIGVLRTAAAFQGLPIEITEEEYAGATLSVIRIAGLPLPMPGMVPGMEPMPPFDEPGGDINVLSVTVHDGLLYLGMDDFVRSALDRGADDGLAATERYRSALDAAAEENAGVVYVDVTAARQLMETLMAADGEQSREYATEIKPYLDHVSRLAVVSVRDGDELVSRTLLFVE